VKIIDTYDNSRYGNDCYICEEYILANIFGVKKVLTASKVDGWCSESTNVRIISNIEELPTSIKHWMD
jgi:hypothetical protein